MVSFILGRYYYSPELHLRLCAFPKNTLNDELLFSGPTPVMQCVVNEQDALHAPE
jgi:hypothetical protein